MSRYDPLTLCRPEERPNRPGYDCYVADPAEVYPATIARIREALDARERAPEELVGGTHPDIPPAQRARRYVSDARKLGARAWDLAALPRDEVTDPDDVALRAEALELARYWFTVALRAAIGFRPIHLHLVNRPAFRL